MHRRQALLRGLRTFSARFLPQLCLVPSSAPALALAPPCTPPPCAPMRFFLNSWNAATSKALGCSRARATCCPSTRSAASCSRSRERSASPWGMGIKHESVKCNPCDPHVDMQGDLCRPAATPGRAPHHPKSDSGRRVSYVHVHCTPPGAWCYVSGSGAAWPAPHPSRGPRAFALLQDPRASALLFPRLTATHTHLQELEERLVPLDVLVPVRVLERVVAVRVRPLELPPALHDLRVTKPPFVMCCVCSQAATDHTSWLVRKPVRKTHQVAGQLLIRATSGICIACRLQ